MMSNQRDIPEGTKGDGNAAITLLGRRGSPAAYAIRDFLHRSDVPFRWVELTSDEEARTKAQVSGLDDPRLPVCVFPDGTRFENPTVRQITEKLGWFRNPSRSEYDLAIYGAGPAALSAAASFKPCCVAATTSALSAAAPRRARRRCISAATPRRSRSSCARTR